MNIEQFREYCLSLPFATEDMPFDDTVLVFRLKGKIFGAIILDKPNLVVLKCEPEYALELRERYPEIEGAHHWNKNIGIRFISTDKFLMNLLNHFADILSMK